LRRHRRAERGQHGDTNTDSQRRHADAYADRTPIPSSSARSTPRPTTAIGGEQVYTYSTDERMLADHTQQAQIYAGNASTVRNSAITVAYDPRDAIFTLTLSDPKSGATASTRFQDPGSRTNFGGAVEPQWGTPISTV